MGAIGEMSFLSGRTAGKLKIMLVRSARYVKHLITASATQWPIVLACLLIFSLQAIAATVSYHRERNHQLRLIDSTYQGWFASIDPKEVEVLVARLDNLIASPADLPFPLLGYRLVQSSGRAARIPGEGFSAGNFENLGLGFFAKSPSQRYFPVSQFYDTRLSAESANLANPASNQQAALMLRVDASHMRGILLAGFWQSLFSIFLVTALSVAGILLLWRRRIFTPLQESRQVNERLSHFARLNANLLWETDRRLHLTYVENNIDNQSTEGTQNTRRASDQPNGFLAGVSSRIEEGEMSGQSALAVLSSAGVSAETIETIVESLKADGSWEGEIPQLSENTSVQSRPSVIKIVAQSVDPSASGAGEAGFRGLLLDTTQHSTRSRELEHQAHHDELTGLSNRRACDSKLDIVVEAFHHHLEKQEEPPPAVVCMLDLDQFKTVNDSCGHAAGDALLSQVAKLLQSAVRDIDMVARVGGDEFCIVLESCSIDKAVEIAERILFFINDYRFHWRGKSYSIGVSIGIVEMSDEFPTAGELITAADACMYRSKQGGRNQIKLHSPNDEQLQQQRAELAAINSIKDALEDERLILYFQQLQPCESTHNRKTGHHQQMFVEVLSRMISEDGETLLPEDYMPVAEKFNLLPAIDRYMCEKVFRHLADVSHSAASDSAVGANGWIRLSVNLSSLSVVDRAFQSFLLDSLERAEFDVSSVYFEIPESALVLDFELVTGFLKDLSSTGCGIIIDDFGVGAISIAQLLGQPVSTLKIAGQLTKELDKNLLNEIVLRGIVDACPMLEVELVAKCVEDSSLQSVLLKYEFDFLQGFHYFKPQPLSSLQELQALPEVPPLASGQCAQSDGANPSGDNDGARHAA